MPMSCEQRWPRQLILITAPSIALLLCARARGGPINSDVAFTRRQGGSILRLKCSYMEVGARGNIRHVNSSTITGTYVYGLKPDLALFFTLPYMNRQVDRVLPTLGRIEEAHDGVADPTFLAKYRFWQNDTRPRETFRLAALGGLNIRSGDSEVTSDSYDPIVGAVFT